MLDGIAEFLSGMIEEVAEPVIACFPGLRGRLVPQPGDYFRARRQVDVRAYTRGASTDVFPCQVPASMIVRVSDEHYAPGGEVLVTPHHDGHVLLLPVARQRLAKAHGYLLMIPLPVLKKSFKPISRAV